MILKALTHNLAIILLVSELFYRADRTPLILYSKVEVLMDDQKSLVGVSHKKGRLLLFWRFGIVVALSGLVGLTAPHPERLKCQLSRIMPYHEAWTVKRNCL